MAQTLQKFNNYRDLLLCASCANEYYAEDDEEDARPFCSGHMFVEKENRDEADPDVGECDEGVEDADVSSFVCRDEEDCRNDVEKNSEE